MSLEKFDERLARILDTIPKLSENQASIVETVVSQFSKPTVYTALTPYLSQRMVDDFGDHLQVHHCFSNEPFSKDKFEYGLQSMFLANGIKADLAPRGNPGYDVEIGGEKVSLKTEAAENINWHRLHISKFMEMGKGDWEEDINDIAALRDRFLERIRACDRILMLRALYRNKNWKHEKMWVYELVEIPNELMLLAEHGELAFSSKSKAKSARPADCHVFDSNDNLIFNLNFDGGSERKLQVRNLQKSYCTVHATWVFTSGDELSLIQPPKELAAKRREGKSSSKRKNGPSNQMKLL